MTKELYEDSWLRFRLFDEMSWHPERLGKRRRVFSAASNLPMAGLYMEPASVEEHREWKTHGEGKAQSLFTILGSIAEVNQASVLYATNDDGTYVIPHWERPFVQETWNCGDLAVFQYIPAEQGGAQYLVLLFRERQGAVIFTRYAGLKIDYYGDDKLWQELSDALYRKVARPSNG